MFEAWKKSQTLLGMNARNLKYIRPFNRVSGKKLADNKILCKRVLAKHDLPVPALIAKIRNVYELEAFNWESLPSSFALKPNRGFGGEGILVVYGKKKNQPDTWIKADGSLVNIRDLKTHIRNILDGSFSLANLPDTAFFEERLKLLKLFKPYSFKGIPDIRVIVFNGIPVMAMLRLPTKDSGGKANLHQGAIGVGIDLASGTTTTAVFSQGKIIDYIPGTRLILSGLKIPYWKDILTLAVQAQRISHLGFLGADIAIDRERGPVFIELNARPGLSIQTANLDGLKHRLERVTGLKVKNIAHGVRMGMDLFGGEIAEEVEEIYGKKILGAIETVKLIGKGGREVELQGKIDTGAGYSSMDFELAKELGFEKTVAAYQNITASYENLKSLSPEERQKIFESIPDVAGTVHIHSSHGSTYRVMVKVEIVLGGIPIPAKVSLIDRSHLEHPLLIGHKNLRRFLVDVSKNHVLARAERKTA